MASYQCLSAERGNHFDTGLNFQLRTLGWEAGLKFNSFLEGIVWLTISSLSVSQVILDMAACGFKNTQPNPISRCS